MTGGDYVMRTVISRSATIGAVLALCGALAGCGEEKSTSSGDGGGQEKQSGPITIGAAIDQTKLMKNFDGPALASAKLRAEEINAQGGVNGRKIEFKVQNTQLDPDRTRSAALSLTEAGADIMWVTCDVDFSTPSIQVALSKKLLTVAPCIGTDQMGPKRFGEAGKQAFSFGNVAQDEGAAVAQMAYDKGFRTANVVMDKSIVYTQNVCAAFAKGFEGLGGKIALRESFTEGDKTIGNVVSRVNRSDADTIAFCATTQNDLPAFVSGVRGGGNKTPIVGPWSIDGAYWLPKNKKASDEIYLTTYASVYGDDPSPEVRGLIDQLTKSGTPPVTGGFLAGAGAIDGLVAALKETGGSTEGAKLAGALTGFKDLQTVSGKLSFSDEFHTAFGREYRIIEIQNGKPRFTGLVKAKTPAEL